MITPEPLPRKFHDGPHRTLVRCPSKKKRDFPRKKMPKSPERRPWLASQSKSDDMVYPAEKQHIPYRLACLKMIFFQNKVEYVV